MYESSSVGSSHLSGPKCLDVDDLAYDYVLEHNHITLHCGVCLIFQHWYLLQSTHLGRQGDNEQDVLFVQGSHESILV